MVDRIRVNIPLARIVQGDLYKANDIDFETKQKRVYPAGHRLAGQPKITYFFALAVPKRGEQHWSQTTWGKLIWEFGFQAWPVDPRMSTPQFPQGMSLAQKDDFAWKIDDGDSQKPVKQTNRINARTEGMPGCWIVSCSSTYAPRVIDTSFAPMTEPNAVKRGFHVETVVTVDTNERLGNPGIYINGEFVMFKAIDKEISGSVDPRTIQGFGTSAVPANLTAVGGGAPTATPSFPTPGIPVPNAGYAGLPPPQGSPSPVVPAPWTGAYAQYGALGTAPTTAASPFNPPPTGTQQPPPAQTTYVVPAPSFLQPPPAAPLPPPAAPAPLVSHQMTAKAVGASYEQFRSEGWSDDQLRQNGYMM